MLTRKGSKPLMRHIGNCRSGAIEWGYRRSKQQRVAKRPPETLLNTRKRKAVVKGYKKQINPQGKRGGKFKSK